MGRAQVAHVELMVAKIIGGVGVVAIGIACLHIQVIGRWVGLFVIVGALGEILNVAFRRSSVWMALVLYAVLFVAVYYAIPHLIRIGPHHWLPPW